MFGFFFVAFVAVFGIVFFISYKLLEDREDTDSDWSSSQSPEPDYFQQTQTAPWELKYNKGKQGEYQLGQVLNQLYGYKKILYNLYIFKEDGTTTEIDALLIHPSGIYILSPKTTRAGSSAQKTGNTGLRFFPEAEENPTRILFSIPLFKIKSISNGSAIISTNTRQIYIPISSLAMTVSLRKSI